MYIDPVLFDECFCPAGGIGRVCLRGDRNIPETLVNLAKKIDGENYNPSCFAVDIFNGGASINYSAEHGFIELGYTCENYADALTFYKNNADPVDIRETFKYW